MNQSANIADLFLSNVRGRNDARERAELFLARLAKLALWRPEEIEELRRLIAEGLKRSAS